MFPFRKQTPSVSVLVPVYNTSRFLRQCLDSLVAQTLRDMQVVCINDGSTDDSAQILAEYAARDSRIEVITQENAGYGAAMNAGLDAAQGEYIGIVESDDFASPEMFKTYYRYASKRRLDMLKSNYFEYSDGASIPVRPYDVLEYDTVFDPARNQPSILVLPAIWSGVYRRGLLLDNGIRFLETPGASFQDTSFVHKAWFAAQRVAVIEDSFLHYRVDNENSSVMSDSKIYEILGEFAASEDFLRADPQRYAVYAHLLVPMKLNTYRWNYNRIASQHRLGFTQRWVDEFERYEFDGLIWREDFDDYNWGVVQELLGGAESFVAAHPEDL